MTTSVTIRLDRDLVGRLDKAARDSGRTRSDLVREALTRQLAVKQFDLLRERTMPFAEARGFLTDDDVFDEVS